MDFRRGGHRDERRRRVLIEETVADNQLAASARHGDIAAEQVAAEPPRRYSDAALSPRQPRVIDLIPTRCWTNLVLAALLLSCAAALEALYGYVALGYTSVTIAQLPALDLASGGSIAIWFCAALLAASGVMGILTYQIRRHRVDDYRGRYRMWYWMVAVMLLASVDCVACVQETVCAALVYALRIPHYADALWVWDVVMAVIVATIAARLALEMWASRLAILCLLAALSCMGAVAAVRVEWLLVDGGVFRIMALSWLTLGGHIALFMALCLYARHVHRDARGKTNSRKHKQRAKSNKRQRSEEASESALTAKSDTTRSAVTRRQAGKVLRQDAAHVSGRTGAVRGGAKPAGVAGAGDRHTGKVKRRVAAQAEPGGASRPSAAADEAPVAEPRKLSKAERKLLRKQRRRDRQQP